jgi:Topoisomerase DNA binding C4 zinc finger
VTPLLLPGGLVAILALWAVVRRLHRASRIFPAHKAPPVRVGDRCPACRSGTIRPADGRFGDFLGCSAFPACQAAWKLGGTVRIRGRNYGRVG